MPFPTLSRTTQKRAITQASSNTESNQAVVTRTYTDNLGNITAADVQVKGAVKSLVQVPNASGLKLYKGASVEIRFVQGSSHYRQITGAAGSSTAAATAAGSTPAPAAPSPSDYNAGNAPVLLQSADTADNPGGFVQTPGANVLFTDTAPGTASGGQAVNGQRTITVRPLVSPVLPSAQTTTLPDGTLLDLVDSYGNPQGMYRLDAGAGVWRRRDVGSSAGGSITVIDSAGNSASGTVIKIVGGTVSAGTGADAGKIIFTVNLDGGTF